jgi:hypothetical protein
VWASLLAWPVLGERIAKRTIVCVVLAIRGGLMLCYGSGLRFDGSGTVDARQTTGLILAVGTGLFNALTFTAISSAVVRAPEADMLVGNAHGFALQAICGILLEPAVGGAAFALPLWEPSNVALGWMIGAGLTVATALSLFAVACEMVTPSEVRVRGDEHGVAASARAAR